jgi:quinol-cytochrome oxidoreductase complex cytochrome b subunit
MASELETYGTGIGIPYGFGAGAAAALFAGLQAEFAVVAMFGAMGGLVVGGFTGRYAEQTPPAERWEYRVVAFTLIVSLLGGGLLGALTAWMVDTSLTIGFMGGAAAGGAFSLLMGTTLILISRRSEYQEASMTGD